MTTVERHRRAGGNSLQGRADSGEGKGHLLLRVYVCGGDGCGDERGLLARQTADEVRAFQKQWYGATEESREIQCALAVEKLGIGERIEPDEARPGDFLQFWRTNKSGHSVVFLEWVEEDGRRVGFKYRSSQGSTKGIGDRVEYFADADGKEGLVDRERMYFCRLNEATQVKSVAGIAAPANSDPPRRGRLQRRHARGLVRHISASSAAAMAAQMRIA